MKENYQSIIGIDIAKKVCHLVCLSQSGRVQWKKKLKRQEVLSFLGNQGLSLIGIESCGGAHFWGRKLREIGHEVRLIAPKFVKPFVKSNKNDFNDAEAIAEAVSRENMRFVPIKEEWQQELQAVHRMRERLIRDRTALVNELRGILMEYGEVIPRNIATFVSRMQELLMGGAFENTLLRKFLEQGMEHFRQINWHVDWCDEQIKRFSKESPVCQRIEKIEGVGPISSTALASSIGDFRRFKKSRDFAAFLGLVPRQFSSGDKTKLAGISKRGDPRLRTLMIHGARAAILRSKQKPDRRSQWIQELYKKKGLNLACVALANKNARTIWALVTREENYEHYLAA